MLWLLRPRWLVTHVLLVASVVTMLALGRWQWDVGRSGGSGEGSLLNYGYALQWWVFCGFAVFLWTRFVRDERGRRRIAGGLAPVSSGPQARRERAEAPKPAPYRGYAMPQMAQVREVDPDLVAYNDYLSHLDVSHLDSAHVDSAHVDSAHVGLSPVDAAHVDLSHVDLSHVGGDTLSPVTAGPDRSAADVGDSAPAAEGDR